MPELPEVDTIANQYLIEFSDFKPLSAPIIGLVAHSNCTYIKAIAYPDKIDAGLSVKKLGNSSVTYSIGIFKKGENTPCAYGEFVHVFVDKKDNQPTSMPKKIREALQKIL